MINRPQSTDGDDALGGGTEASSDPTSRRRERPRRSAPEANRRLADLLENPQSSQPSPANLDPSAARRALIATAAYYRAEKRGFLPGHEQEDWLAVEREIDDVGSEPMQRA
jgi:hypothetical protein